MPKSKITVTLDEQSISKLDRLVEERVFKNRSQAVQAAVTEKLRHLLKTRLARESMKLNPAFERNLAEEGIDMVVEEWPEY